MHNWTYANPVKISFGMPALAEARRALVGRSFCLVTYNDNPAFDRLVDRVIAEIGQPAAIVRDVEPNPSFAGLRMACRSFASAETAPEVILALGGGSVIDTAKVLAAAGGDFDSVKAYLEGKADIASLTNIPIIAVPTTAGTGSEVTCWATVWDTEARRKYSLSHTHFYPEHAILDPSLTLGVPAALTRSTGLDALSHAFESIWNINANPVSSNHAISAAREIIDVLPQLLADLDNAVLRERMMHASLFAGLAFSNTKTALAHSLSYYLTLHHGTVHGIACSFSLPVILRSVIGRNAACDAALRSILGDDLTAGATKLEAFLLGLGVSTRATDYGVAPEDWLRAIDDALKGERGQNFIGDRDAVVAAAA